MGTSCPRLTAPQTALSGMKGSMLECDGLLPIIANSSAKTPASKVSAELIDAKLPETVVFDARSIAPQLRGEAGTPRERVDSQLAAMWYVRDAKWKLNEKAELYNMSNAPFAETLITIDAPESTAAQPRRSRACREVR